jgi:acetolactate synthase-1/2/3 large subunit
VNVTTGPGGINALNGVFGAHTDSLPMIVVSGQVKRETMLTTTGLPLRQLGDQEVDIISMAKPITKMAEVLFNPEDVLFVMEKAIWMATTGRPGAVWIDIPVDVQAMQVDRDKLRHFDPLLEGLNGEYGVPMETGALKQSALRTACETILKRLTAADRPVILAGTGIRISGVYERFLQLIDRLGVPVTTAWNAHDLLPNSHPLYTGRPGPIGERAGNFVVQNSDLCIVLGTRLSIRQVGYNYRSFARAAFKVMVDIDKAELVKPTLSIDLPIHADLNNLIDMLLELSTGYAPADRHSAYVSWAKERLARYTCLRKRSSSNLNPLTSS